MCGITGILDVEARREVDRALLSRMTDSLGHRGPDADGFHVEPGVGLGHRRLSIIDIGGGQQPMYNEDGSVAITYNGEIYNFPALHKELVALGHEFRTRCDTEVVVHAWEEWGEDCVRRLRGMFAFAIWDRNSRSLFLARDRLGIKPLFYAQLHNGWFIFASELKALLEHPGLEREMSPRAVEDYFAYGYVPEPDTILKAARKLPPAHTLRVGTGRRATEPRAFWDVPFAPGPPISDTDAARELVDRLGDAVRMRMIAEVPLGAFLSGGVDSSAVVAMMAQASDAPVHTCSISFGDPRFNESQFAARVARRYETDHRVEQVDTDDFDLVDRLASLYDEPFADSSAIPTYRVCELARRQVIVALSGDGGDENFAGYRRYRWHAFEERFRALLPLAMRGPLFGTLGRMYPKADWAPRFLRARATFEAIARGSVEGYFHAVSILGDDLRRRLFSPAFRRELQGYSAVEVLEGHARNCPTDDPLGRIQYLDFKTYLPGDILTKVDRASMAHSLEVRVPMLDHEVVEWVSGLPSSLKLRGHEGKYLLKKAFESHLPREVLYRTKMGFAVPLASWFRGPLRAHVRERLLGPLIAGSPVFDAGFVAWMIEQHQAGVRDFSAPIWSLLMFESFQRNVLEAGGERPRAIAVVA